MADTLATLVVPQSVTYFFNLILSVYQAEGFPVTAWQEGGTERTRALALATALADKATNYAPQIAAGILLDFSSSDGNGGGWLPLTAQEFFNLTQNGAVFTQGNILLTAASGVSSQTYAAGKLKATFAATGNSYLNVNSVTIPAGPGSVSALFQAQFPGASYADQNNGAVSLTTPIPGVTLTNPASTYTSVTHTGSGTGTLTLGGSPPAPHSVVVTITGTGASGVASWQYSIDGAAAVSAGTASSLSNIGGTGINITLVNGGSGTSFVTNDTYAFNTPGSWITQQGANIESDPNLKQRCRNRWASLAAIPTQNYYELLATSTPTVGAQVVSAIVVPDATINNKVNIVIAGPSGVLPGSVVTAVQNFIGPYARGCDNPVVQSPSTTSVTLAGTIYLQTSLSASAQTAIQTAMSNYVSVQGIGVNGTVELAAIIALLKPNPLTGTGGIAGVNNVSGLTINGVAADLVLGSPSTFVIPALQPLSFTYINQ